MIIPGIAAAAVVHAPIGVTFGQSIPLGLASFDEDVVEVAHRPWWQTA